ncbi:hypothetical protein [Streptomyces sp. NPDC001286]
MCRQLADQGLRVLVEARRPEAAEEACRVIGPAALPLALDVTSAKSVTEAVREATGPGGWRRPSSPAWWKPATDGS